ncbi:hypothetical protein D8S78_05635 [Natrialba swarupiae]|nr:hypothetical protein [Natrialba swarupiae]
MNVDWPFEWGGSKRNEPSEVDRLWTSLGAATLVLAVIFAGIAGYYAAVGRREPNRLQASSTARPASGFSSLELFCGGASTNPNAASRSP